MNLYRNLLSTLLFPALLTGEAIQRTPISETEQHDQALQLRGTDSAMVRSNETD